MAKSAAGTKKPKLTDHELLAMAGISAPWQVAMVMPDAYRDNRAPICSFALAPTDGQTATFVGRISSPMEPRLPAPKGGGARKRSPFIILKLSDGQGWTLTSFIFGQHTDLLALIDSLGGVGSEVWISGACSAGRNPCEVLLSSPRLVDPAHRQQLVVEYRLQGKRNTVIPGAGDIIARHIGAAISTAASEIRGQLKPLLDAGRDLRAIIGCPKGVTIERLLEMIHFPRTAEEGVQAQACVERLAAVMVLTEAIANAKEWGGARRALSISTVDERIARIPFEMTEEQRVAAKGICQNLTKPIATRSMLIGDVGTGKTCVIAVAAAVTCDAGGRVAILLPSTNLAQQMHAEISGYFPELDPQLLCDGSTVTNRNSSLWIGTTALLSGDWGGVPFDLVVTDEQHKYSVGQREHLCAGGAHLLEATATPVPRTAALLKHGVIRQFRLSECFVQKTLITRIWGEGERGDLMRRSRQILAKGGKILIICPLKEESESEAMANCVAAEVAYSQWSAWVERNKANLPGGTRVVLAHGGQASDVNTAALQAMKDGSANIMVSTTVVETGVTIPNLRQVLILNPERLGIVQHHQLRGRLARHGGFGYYDMFVDGGASEKSLERLTLLCQTTDGLELAEMDMRLRGSGDLSGAGRQQTGDNNRHLFGRQISAETLSTMMDAISQAPARRGAL